MVERPPAIRVALFGVWRGRSGRRLFGPGARSGRLDGHLVLVELHEVVGRGDQPPFERAADLPRRWNCVIRRLCLV